ncbi:hypothetical protein KEM56_006023 [Ascosphaera pollenicola]|nr:hypothetical protein KEM56_006023 [Ascosphaera pollenicola]
MASTSKAISTSSEHVALTYATVWFESMALFSKRVQVVGTLVTDLSEEPNLLFSLEVLFIPQHLARPPMESRMQLSTLRHYDLNPVLEKNGTLAFLDFSYKTHGKKLSNKHATMHKMNKDKNCSIGGRPIPGFAGNKLTYATISAQETSESYSSSSKEIQLKRSSESSDFTGECRGKRFPAHKSIVGSHSDVIKTALCGNQFKVLAAHYGGNEIGAIMLSLPRKVIPVSSSRMTLIQKSWMVHRTSSIPLNILCIATQHEGCVMKAESEEKEDKNKMLANHYKEAVVHINVACLADFLHIAQLLQKALTQLKQRVHPYRDPTKCKLIVRRFDDERVLGIFQETILSKFELPTSVIRLQKFIQHDDYDALNLPHAFSVELIRREFPEADAIEFESDSSDAASDKSVDNTYSVLQMRADVEYALLVTFFGVMKIAKHWQLHRLYEWVRVDKLSIGLDADKDPLGYMTFLEAAASANVLREFEAEALSGLPRDKSKLWAFLKHNDYAIFALSQSFRIVLLGMLREWFDATDSENPYLKIAADDEPRRSRLSKYCSTELGRAVSSRPQLKTLCYLPYSKGFTEGDDERLR